MEYLNIKKDEKILIVAPHPDDECIGVGGLLSMYPNNCSVLVITDGCIGQGDQAEEVTRQIRRKEFVSEMEYLNIKEYSFLDITDGSLISHTDCLKNIDFSAFSKIFVTGRRDGHSDHMAAFASVVNAVEYQNINPQIFEYEVHSPLISPTHMLDISDYMEEKKMLIKHHMSQLKVFAYDNFAEVTAKYRAMQDRRNSGFIEVYKLVNNKTMDNNYELEVKLQKHIKFYQVLTNWMDKRNKGKYIYDFLAKKNIHSVAIYGFAELGKLVVDELVSSDDINVCYIMDKRVINNEKIRVIKPSENNPVVDAVIVTAINSYDIIRDELLSLGYKNIYSLGLIIDDM